MASSFVKSEGWAQQAQVPLVNLCAFSFSASGSSGGAAVLTDTPGRSWEFRL